MPDYGFFVIGKELYIVCEVVSAGDATPGG
jgi:hypothetical protein